MAATRLPNPWVDDPISALVSQRYPEGLAHAFGRPTASKVAPEKIAENVKLYRMELNALTEEELAERVSAGRKLELERELKRQEFIESQRFFHRPDAAMDVAHWSKMSFWTIDEAVALSLGKDPRVVAWPMVQSEVANSPFAKAYADRREIAMRAKVGGQLYDSTIPGVFLAWARRMMVQVPEELISAVEGLGVQIRDWKAAYDEQCAIVEKATVSEMEAKRERLKDMHLHSKYIEKLAADYTKLINDHVVLGESYKAENQSLKRRIIELESAPVKQAAVDAPTERPFGTRERDSLLKLVIGIAVKGYGHDPKASRTGTAREIAGDLQLLGIPLDEDTVRKFLSDAKALLPPIETEQNG